MCMRAYLFGVKLLLSGHWSSLDLYSLLCLCLTMHTVCLCPLERRMDDLWLPGDEYHIHDREKSWERTSERGGESKGSGHWTGLCVYIFHLSVQFLISKSHLLWLLVHCWPREGVDSLYIWWPQLADSLISVIWILMQNDCVYKREKEKTLLFVCAWIAQYVKTLCVVHLLNLPTVWLPR